VENANLSTGFLLGPTAHSSFPQNTTLARVSFSEKPHSLFLQHSSGTLRRVSEGLRPGKKSLFFHGGPRAPGKPSGVPMHADLIVPRRSARAAWILCYVCCRLPLCLPCEFAVIPAHRAVRLTAALQIKGGAAGDRSAVVLPPPICVAPGHQPLRHRWSIYGARSAPIFLLAFAHLMLPHALLTLHAL
jgi:hypothetical protein